MSKKTLATLGMIFSLVLVFISFLVFAGAMGGDVDYPSSAPYNYDSGYASFGADFYSYVSNNAAEAASASRTAANNVRELCDLLKTVSGFFMLGFGLLGFCHFGIVRCDCTKKETIAAADEVEASVTEEEVAVEAEEPAETVEETVE